MFKPIPGYDGYFVDEHGVVLGRSGRRLRLATDRYATAWSSGYKYFRAVIRSRPSSRRSRLPRVKRVYVHTAVLLAFVGPCPMGMECRHLDSNRSNNELSNLCWGTRKENRADTILAGHACQPAGVHSHCSRFSLLEVEAMRVLYWEFSIPIVGVARLFGACKSTISYIVNYKTYSTSHEGRAAHT